MWKISFWILTVAAAAIFISGRFRISKRYEREDKSIKEVSSWRSLDRGVDPTDSQEIEDSPEDENHSK
jgi:hypothetical protein